MNSLVWFAIIMAVTNLIVFGYFCLFFLPQMREILDRYNLPQTKLWEKNKEKEQPRPEVKKGKVYNPSKDLDRTMSKGKPQIFS